MRFGSILGRIVKPFPASDTASEVGEEPNDVESRDNPVYEPPSKVIKEGSERRSTLPPESHPWSQ